MSERTNVMFDESLSVNKSNCCSALDELKTLCPWHYTFDTTILIP